MQSDISSSAVKLKSLYREITIALVLLVSLVSITVSLLNYVYSSREADALLESKASGYTANLRESLEWPLWNLDDELIGKIGAAFVTNAEIAELTIRDDQQRVVYHHANPNGKQIKRKFVIEHEGKSIGGVEIGLSLHAYEEKNRWLLFNSIITALLLIVSLLGALRWMLARLLKKPVDALVGVIDEVVAGNYPQIDLSQTYSEFAPIVSGFKIMSDVVASREASLRGSEQKLLSILEGVDACIYLKDTEGRYLFANRSVRELWHVDMNDLVGFGDEKFFDAATVDNIRKNDRRVLADGVTLRTEEVNTIPATGETFSYQSTKLPLHREDGSIYALCGISVDITDRKRVEEELRKYKDHLEEEVQTRTTDLVLARNAAETANRAKSVFLANMSHELRTPLNAILGFSNLMRKAVSLSREQRENLDIINRSGEYLLTLINDVLEMAKIESGRVQLESQPLDLGTLVRDVTDMMQVRAAEKNLQLLLDQSSEFPRYIRGDEARLRQVLINLVGNAVKFTRQGGVTVRFGMKPYVTPQCLLIEVEDTGPGIKAEDREKIFEPFVQIGETSMQKGTGLGLTITRQFVQLMGGTISLESTPGTGSIFRVELPVEITGVVVNPEAAIQGDIAGLAPGQPEYRILIVEDQLENQLLLKQLMQRIGLQVAVATDGQQAVELFRSWHPDLIWMDRRMPVMDGIEATRHIRQLPGGAEVKIVAVTASAFMEQRDEMLAAGMDEFVRKPYRFNEIYEALSKQLGVKYTYSEDAELADVADVELTAQMLSVLPHDLRRELRVALESLEDERIGAVIGQVTDAKLQKLLSHLAGNFDYPAILKALQGDVLQ